MGKWNQIKDMPRQTQSGRSAPYISVVFVCVDGVVLQSSSSQRTGARPGLGTRRKKMASTAHYLTYIEQLKHFCFLVGLKNLVDCDCG